MESSEFLFRGVRNGRVEGWSDACAAIAERLRVLATDSAPLDKQVLLDFANNLPLLPCPRA